MSALSRITKNNYFEVFKMELYYLLCYLDYRWMRTVRRWPTAGRQRWDVLAWLSHHTTDIRNKVAHGLAKHRTEYSTLLYAYITPTLEYSWYTDNTRHTCLREEQWRRRGCVSRRGRVQTGRAQQQPAAARVQLVRLLAETMCDGFRRCQPKIKNSVRCFMVKL